MKKSVAGGFCYTYEYRADGKLLKKYSSGRLVVSCTCFRDGSLKSLTDVTGRTTWYEYDGDGRLAGLKDDAGKTLTVIPLYSGREVEGDPDTFRGKCVLYL